MGLLAFVFVFVFRAVCRQQSALQVETWACELVLIVLQDSCTTKMNDPGWTHEVKYASK